MIILCLVTQKLNIMIVMTSSCGSREETGIPAPSKQIQASRSTGGKIFFERIGINDLNSFSEIKGKDDARCLKFKLDGKVDRKFCWNTLRAICGRKLAGYQSIINFVEVNRTNTTKFYFQP